MTRLHACRICTKPIESSKFVSLFDNGTQHFLFKIKAITGLELVDNKNMPKYMCEHCNFDLDLSYKFRECCMESQKYFEQQPTVLCIDDIIESVVDESNNEEDDILEEHIISETEVLMEEREQCESEVEFIVSNNEQTFDSIDQENTNDLVVQDDSNECQSYVLADYQMEYQSFQNNLIKIEKDDLLLPKMENEEFLQFKKEVDEEELMHPNMEGMKVEKRKKIEKLPKKKTTRKTKETAPFICDQCGDKFTTRHYFLTHLQRHKGEKPYECEICNVKFYTNGQLHRHMRVHTRARPYPCQHCGRTFTDYSTRVRHERTHTNERPYKCQECGKAFGISFVLKNHMLTHTGEKPFQCKPCNKAFALKSHLANHIRTLTHRQNEELMNRT